MADGDQHPTSARQKSHATRRARADFTAQLRRDHTPPLAALQAAESDPLLNAMRISELLEALPLVGKVKAAAVMTTAGIAPTRRIRTLTAHQRDMLVELLNH